MQDLDNRQIEMIIKLFARHDFGNSDFPQEFLNNANTPTANYIVAAIEKQYGKAMGGIFLRRIDEGRLSTDLIKVAEEYEGNGIASKMYEFLFKHADNDIVAIASNPDNDNTIGLHDKYFTRLDSETPKMAILQRVGFVKSKTPRWIREIDAQGRNLDEASGATESHLLTLKSKDTAPPTGRPYEK